MILFGSYTIEYAKKIKILMVQSFYIWLSSLGTQYLVGIVDMFQDIFYYDGKTQKIQ